MDGAALRDYVTRRLAEENLALPPEREADLFDLITEARDSVRQILALSAPLVVCTWLLLEQDGADDRVWRFPEAAPDPLRVVEVRAKATRRPLTHAATLDHDAGEYEWTTLRELRLALDACAPGGVEVRYASHVSTAIGATTAEGAVGLPAPTHRALAKWAVVLALTADEESDAANALAQFREEADRLERLYGDYDRSAGASIGLAFEAAYRDRFGDLLN